MGPFIEKYRKDFFLATKTEGRTYKEAWGDLHKSLKRLKTDNVDMWQMHCLVEEKDWQTAMGPGGALEAFIKSREKGLVRFLGVTGHGINAPDMHLRSLKRFDFDSVLLVYNFPMMQNKKYVSDFERLYELCMTKGIAFQTIKSLARGEWGDKEHIYSTWYEPLDEQNAIDKVVFWILNRKNIFLNSSADIRLLEKILDAANRYSNQKISDEEMMKLINQKNITPLFIEEKEIWDL